jgi:hypothetical protein
MSTTHQAKSKLASYYYIPCAYASARRFRNYRGEATDLCKSCARIFELFGDLGIGQEDLVKTSGAEMLRELLASPRILERHFYRRGILMTAVANHKIAE